jgi:hypothetical protein
MTALIRGAARCSRAIAMWEHGGFTNLQPEPQIIINGRFPLDKSEQMRLNVLKVIEEGAAERMDILSRGCRSAPPALTTRSQPPVLVLWESAITGHSLRQ